MNKRLVSLALAIALMLPPGAHSALAAAGEGGVTAEDSLNLRGVVTEDGDHYVIDVAPCDPDNATLRVQKAAATVRPFGPTTCPGPGGETHQLSQVVISGGTNAGARPEVCVPANVGDLEQGSLDWCGACLTPPQSVLTAGLFETFARAYIRDRGQCDDVVNRGSDAAIAVAVGAGLGAGAAATMVGLFAVVLVHECGRCVCRRVF